MFALLALGGLLITQAGGAMSAESSAATADVAYEQLANGETRAAIARLEAALVENPGDPALLINLGSAYAEIGDNTRAVASYRAALTSDQRYRLELAGGEWVDSRTAARRGLLSLEERGFASR